MQGISFYHQYYPSQPLTPVQGPLFLFSCRSILLSYPSFNYMNSRFQEIRYFIRSFYILI
ncbi:MAG: hypothetical protein CVV44_02230 [Spirochaetae bacterium HGW-Spirochaetae-1]|nr:MAG: hypothetical protein CVV44_02230 [Spirochaetae bacterium HGW-Spirochaetae-1]